MANNISNNPIILDTTGTVGYNIAQPLTVTKIVWEAPTTAGHIAQIVRAVDNTTVLVEATAGANDVGASVAFDFNTPIIFPQAQGGWYLKTLGSGKLLIYVK